jgi:small GTP-binding protein
VLYGIATALSILHDQGIAHRDLNPDNIFLNREFEPKLDHFTGPILEQKPMGRARFMAPEVLSNLPFAQIPGRESHNLSADVYSFGMVMYSVLTGQVPYETRSEIQTAVWIMNGWSPPIPPSVPDQYRDLIKSCWHKDIRQRPTMKYVSSILSTYRFLTREIDLPIARVYMLRTPLLAWAELVPDHSGTSDGIKVALGGDNNTGKTALFRRLRGESFRADSMPTLGCSIEPVTIGLANGHTASLALWDIGGAAQFRAVNSAYFKGAKCVILVFDITSRATFTSLSDWIQLAKDKGAKYVVVGNKTDIIQQREVPFDEADTFAREQGAVSYVEVSVKENGNIQAFLQALSIAIELPGPSRCEVY